MKAEDAYLMFREGSRVEVVRNGTYKKRDLIGKVGTVVTNQYGAYGKIVVKLDDVSNSYGASGRFYFRPLDLLLVNDNNDILEENNMQNVVNYVR